MNWSSWSDFIDMGGYAFYVWSSFGITALAIAGELQALRARRRALQAERHRRGFEFGSPHEA